MLLKVSGLTETFGFLRMWDNVSEQELSFMKRWTLLKEMPCTAKAQWWHGDSDNSGGDDDDLRRINPIFR